MKSDYIVRIETDVDVAKSKQNTERAITQLNNSLGGTNKTVIRPPLKLDPKEIAELRAHLKGTMQRLNAELSQLKGFKYDFDIDKMNKFAESGQRIVNYTAEIQDKFGQVTTVVQRVNLSLQEYNKLLKQSVSENNIDKQSMLFQKYNDKLVKIQNSAKTTQKIISHFGNAEQQQGIQKNVTALSRLGITSDMTEKQMKEVTRAANLQQDSLNNLARQARATGKASLKMKDQLANAMKSFSVWSLVTVAWYRALQELRRGLQSIVELDTALVELQKVTNSSQSDLVAFTKSASEVGDVISRTTSEVVRATAAFARMGFSASAALDLAEQASILVNIGDGIDDVTVASSALIATLKGFNLDETFAPSIVDKLNELSNKFAVNTSDLTTGIAHVSASMKAAGNDLDETLALFTAGVEVLQDASRASTALRTISMRLRGVSEDGENLTGLIPELQEYFDSYGTGVKLIDAATGSFNSTYDILTKLSESWGTLTDMQRADLTEKIAGKRQSDTLNAVLGNQKTLLDSLTVSQESYGSANRENAIYTQSLAAHIERFKKATQDMWQDAISSEFLKLIIKLGTEIVKLVGNIGLVGFAFSTLLAVLVAVKREAMVNVFSGLGLAISSLVKFVNTATFSFSALKSSVGGSTVAVNALYGALTFGLSLALTFIISQISKLNNKRKEENALVEKLKDSYDKETESLKNVVSETERLLLAYDELKSKEKITADESERLLGIKQDLTDLYSTYIPALGEENSLLEKQLGYIKEINEQNKARVLNKSNLTKIEALSSSGALQEETKGLTEQAEELEDNFERVSNATVNFMTEFNQKQEEAYAGNDESLQRLRTLAAEVGVIIPDTEEALGGYYDSVISAGAIMANELSESLIIVQDELGENVAELNGYADAWISVLAYTNTDAFTNASEQLSGLRESFVNGELSVSEFNKEIARIESGVYIANDAIKDTIDLTSAGVLSLNELNSALKSNISEMKNLASIYHDVNEGEQVSLDTIIDLSLQYPKYISEILKLKGANVDRGEVLKVLAEIQREQAINHIRLLEKEFIATNNLASAMTYVAKLSAGSAAAFHKLYPELFGYKQLIEEITSVDFDDLFSSFDNVGKSATESLEAYSARLKSIKKTREKLALLEAQEGSSGVLQTQKKVDLLKELQHQLDLLNDSRVKDLLALEAIVLTEKNQVEVLGVIAKLEADINTSGIEWHSIQVQINGLLDDAEKTVEGINSKIEILTSQQETVNKLIDNTVKLIEKENELYKEQLSDRKESLKLAKDEADLQKELAGLNKDRSDLESELMELRLDDSQNNNARILEIEDELSKTKLSIQGKLDDDAYDQKIRELDKEIGLVDDYLSKEGQIREDAMERVNEAFRTGNGQLLNDLINFNNEYGNSIQSDITDMWYAAEQALQNYGVALDKLDVSKTLGNMNNDLLNNQMALNSAKWHLATTDAERDALHDANKILANQLNPNSSFNNNTGLWDFKPTGNNPSPTSSFNSNGTADFQKYGLSSAPTYSSSNFANMNSKPPSSISINNLMNIEGNVDPSMKGYITNTANNIVSQLDVAINRGNRFISTI